LTPFTELTVFNRITFVEKTHSYLVDGESTEHNMSVTRLIKKHKKDFDKQTIAKRVAKRKRVSTDSVLAEWEQNNLYSTTLGSMLHKYIENFYHNRRIEFEGSLQKLGFNEKTKLINVLPKLVEQFQNFYRDNKNLICIKNEMVVGDVDDTKVCGTMDMLCYNTETKCFEILDFKTNKKMEKSSPWGNLFYPFEDMSEGEINEYTIQLNCYKYFIEKYTTLKIEQLKLIWFNVENKNYEIIVLKDIQEQIKKMFNQFTTVSLFQ
jgi:hypothetical protein